MAQQPSERLPAKPKPAQLSLQGHEQIMDLLHLADRSVNPDIVKVATKLAGQQMKYQHGRQDKTPPSVTVVLSTLVVTAAVGACWFVFTHYKEEVAVGISTVIIAMAIFIIALYALTSGHLSQANFMVIFRWVGDHLKSLIPFRKENNGLGVPLEKDTSIHAAEESKSAPSRDSKKL